MFGNNNNRSGSAEEFLAVIVGIFTFMGTIFVMTYKGVVNLTRWGKARHQDRKEKEQIDKL